MANMENKGHEVCTLCHKRFDCKKSVLNPCAKLKKALQAKDTFRPIATDNEQTFLKEYEKVLRDNPSHFESLVNLKIEKFLEEHEKPRTEIRYGTTPEDAQILSNLAKDYSVIVPYIPKYIKGQEVSLSDVSLPHLTQHENNLRWLKKYQGYAYKTISTIL